MSTEGELSQVLQKAKDFSVVGIRERHWKTILPVPPTGWSSRIKLTPSLEEIMALEEIKGPGRPENTIMNSVFLSLE